MNERLLVNESEYDNEFSYQVVKPNNSRFSSLITDKTNDLRQVLEYLNHKYHNENIGEIIESPETIILFNKIKLYYDERLEHKEEKLRKKELSDGYEMEIMEHLLRNSLQFFLDHFSNYVKKGKIDIDAENSDPKFTKIFLFLSLIETLMIYSDIFAKNFATNGGVKILLNFFADKRLSNYIVKSANDSYKKFRELEYQKALISMLNSILILRARNTYQRETTEILLKFLDAIKEKNYEFLFRVYLIVTFDMKHKDLLKLRNFDQHVKFLENILEVMASDCMKTTELRAFYLCFSYLDDTTNKESFLCLNTKYWYQDFLEYFSSSFRSFIRASDPKSLLKIYETTKNNLEIVLKFGQEKEKIQSILILIELSFNEIVQEKMKENEILLEQIHNSKLFFFSQVLNLSIHSLGTKHFKQDLDDDNYDIAFCFHSVDALKCARLRVELEKQGLCSVNLNEAIDFKYSKRDVLDQYLDNLACSDLVVIFANDYAELDIFMEFLAHYTKSIPKEIVYATFEAKYEPDSWIKKSVQHNSDSKLITIRDFENQVDILKFQKRIQSKLGINLYDINQSEEKLSKKFSSTKKYFKF
jgi:hypothetical protein